MFIQNDTPRLKDPAENHCPFKQMLQGKGRLKILADTIAELSEYRLSPKRFWCNILATFLGNTLEQWHSLRSNP